MPFKANVIKVMIASPSDAPEERQAIRDVIADWNYIHAEDRGLVLLPVGWETHSTPTMGERPQAIINKQVLADCDLLVAVFWTRLGSPTGKAASGTVEEIEEHLKLGKPAMLYFSSAPVRLDSVDDEQYKALKAFKKDCHERGLVESFEGLDHFRELFSRQLAQTIIREFAGSAKGDDNLAETQATVQPSPIRDLLSEDAKKLLCTASDGNGRILQFSSGDGTEIRAGGRNLITQQTPREIARWRSALRELIDHDLIEDVGHEQQIFDLTHRGHGVAEQLIWGSEKQANPDGGSPPAK